MKTFKKLYAQWKENNQEDMNSNESKQKDK